ncbi:PHP domain-containing protein [Pseudogracilibacillus sp. SO30301A]|uniref:PHP domain-containing protein n=1 Tax=Pseudogracilibacillus sp. SO30301A TaxID=3098291 RepID=UPI00300DEAAF
MTDFSSGTNANTVSADLHVHSNYSDGFHSMEGVVVLAKNNGLTEISFTDHDCKINHVQAKYLSEKYEITIIPGIEISAYDFERNRKVHILGYGYDEKARNISSLCDVVSKRRHDYSLRQIKQIQDAGYELNMDEVLSYAKYSETIYKQHIMRALTDAHFASEAYQTLYQTLFKGNGVASGDISYVSAVEAVESIVADGGIAVLAHPGQLDSFEIVPLLAQHGLKGIERNHFDHTVKDMKRVDELARKYDLIMTGGSDFHGLYGKPIGIGEVRSPQSLCHIL